MTVAELIEKLLRYPPTWEVVFNYGAARATVDEVQSTDLWSNSEGAYEKGVELS